MAVLLPIIEFLQDCRKTISLEQVMDATGCPRKPVLRVLDRLVKEGYLTEKSDERIQPKFGECGPPRRNPTWTVESRPETEDYTKKVTSRITVRDRIWKLMRARRRFTRSDLVRLSGVSRASVEDMTKLLVAAGYLRITGKDGRENSYLLVKDCGPIRPHVEEETVRC